MSLNQARYEAKATIMEEYAKAVMAEPLISSIYFGSITKAQTNIMGIENTS